MTDVPELQSTAWQQAETIDLNKTAVLIVDILGGENGAVPSLEDAADNAVKVVKKAREGGVPVVFCNDAHILGLDKEIELWGEHALAGTEGAKPLSSFDVQETDFVIPKRRYDSFFQTDLDLTLRELGVDTLLVCGFDTNICVLHTLAGAYFRGYKTIVCADACGTFLVGTQEDGLAYFSRCYDSRVVDTKTVLSYLAETA